MMLRFDGGERGMLWSSQVAPGNENGLKLRIYGEVGGLDWKQEDPNYLWHTPFGQPKQLSTRGGAGSGPQATAVSRIPAGHPEGYLEGFANIYSGIADAIEAVHAGTPLPADAAHLPGIQAGLDGMSFINACVTSSANNAAWTKV